VPASPHGPTRRVLAARATEVLVGLVSAGLSIVVLANPLISVHTLGLVLAAALSLEGLRLLITGGIHRDWWRRVERNVRSTALWMRRLGRVGIGLILVALVAAILLVPGVSDAAFLYVLAFGVVLVSVDRMLPAVGWETPDWLRASAIGTAAIVLLLVAVALFSPTIGLASIAILLAVSMLVGGVQSVLSGLQPEDPRQIVLLKVVLFSLFYGLVMINWIDLFGKQVPGYGIWLLLTYFAPFMVLLVFEGFSEWALALSLGLLVSLANDVGYFFVGNLLFGFHENLATWIAGQLGFQGSTIVTTFEGGSFAINVTSWEMGLSIYVRAIIVFLGLSFWWAHPSRIVARTSGPVPT
jgi:uncharacterized membrane protein HdeD (DUF308 family)